MKYFGNSKFGICNLNILDCRCSKHIFHKFWFSKLFSKNKVRIFLISMFDSWLEYFDILILEKHNSNVLNYRIWKISPNILMVQARTIQLKYFWYFFRSKHFICIFRVLKCKNILFVFSMFSRVKILKLVYFRVF